MGDTPRMVLPVLEAEQLRYLDIVVFGAGHHQVVLAGCLGDRQAHHGADVAGQLANRLEPVGGPSRVRKVRGTWVGRGSAREGRRLARGVSLHRAACSQGVAWAETCASPLAMPRPLLPRHPDLLSSQMRTALPEAAYSMVPEGLRAIWFTCCSPWAPVKARLDVAAQGSPEVTWPEDLPVRKAGKVRDETGPSARTRKPIRPHSEQASNPLLPGSLP